MGERAKIGCRDGCCWHFKEWDLTRSAPWEIQVCCWCGDTRRKKAEIPDPPRSHGPHEPKPDLEGG